MHKRTQRSRLNGGDSCCLIRLWRELPALSIQLQRICLLRREEEPLGVLRWVRWVLWQAFPQLLSGRHPASLFAGNTRAPLEQRGWEYFDALRRMHPHRLAYMAISDSNPSSSDWWDRYSAHAEVPALPHHQDRDGPVAPAGQDCNCLD